MTKNNQACRAMWSAVIICAIKDLYKIGTTNAPSKKYGKSIQYQRWSSAKEWFESESRHFNSFLTICDYLGLKAGAIRRSLFHHDAEWLKARTRLLYVLGDEGRGESYQ